MGDSSLIFRGNVRVYLQGRDALIPIITNKKQMTYYIGSDQSSILVSDYRHAPNSAALDALGGKNGFEFADVFNLPAVVEIHQNEKNIEIEMRENPQVGDDPILWMGVIDDNMMAVQDIEWEILKPISSTHIAFAALVR